MRPSTPVIQFIILNVNSVPLYQISPVQSSIFRLKNNHMSQQYLIIDNGSYNIKAGFATDDDPKPLKVQNTISKTRDGAIYIGNDYKAQTNNYSGILFKRPHDLGHLTSWEAQKPIWDYTFDQLCPKAEMDYGLIHLTLTEPPCQLPQLSMNTDQIVFEEYGFNEYYRCTAPSLVPWNFPEPSNDIMLVIDSGFSATWIIPVIFQNVHWAGVRKLPVGGKLLSGLLRELVSFRHYDVSDEPILINTIKEETCFVSENFTKDLTKKENLVCEFVLPDFKTTTMGYVKTEETKLGPDTQTLKLADERFTPPESFYHPELLFDNNISSSNNAALQSSPLKNLTDLVVESIMSSPQSARPLLLANITLAGGLTSLPNFKLRLVLELTKELPADWFVRVRELEGKADEVAWLGGVKLTNDEVINSVSVSKKEYFEHGLNWCQKQFGFRNV